MAFLQGTGSRPRWGGRGLVYTVALGLALVVGLMQHGQAAAADPANAPAANPAAVRCDWTNQNFQDFYAPPNTGNDALTEPGKVVRVQFVRTYTPQEVAQAANRTASAYGAEVYLILYLSQGPVGVPQTVSGMMLVPTGARPAEGFPIVAFAHGTTGAADICAPSKLLDETPGAMMRWIADGFMVASTDYQGLGTPSPHFYAVGELSGLAVLDSARAAQNFCDDAHNVPASPDSPVVLVGHSQGGQAALFAQELWPTYAPSLAIPGVVAFAPAAELRFLAHETAELKRTPRLAPFLLGLNSYHDYYNSSAPLSSLLRQPYADELPEEAESQCALGLTAWTGVDPAKVLRPPALIALREENWDRLEPWSTYIADNEPGNEASDTPVLLLQGELDTVVPPESTTRLSQRLCTHGAPVEANRYVGAGHVGVMRRGHEDAVGWINARLAGEPPPTNCLEAVPDGGLPPGRSLDPVIVKGAQLERLLGKPIDLLEVYAVHEDEWGLIPFQVDELNSEGKYVVSEDGLLDANDELVVMVSDLGPRTEAADVKAREAAGNKDFYALQVTDPTGLPGAGWIYVLPTAQVGGAATASYDYVGFSPFTKVITGETYTVGLMAARPGLSDLELGNGPDIVDRTKYYLDCKGFGCPLTEDKLLIDPLPGLIKDGPVRTILYNGNMVAYGSLIVWNETYEIRQGFEGNLRISTDLNAAAQGATFYSVAAPNGVIVDGEPDDVPPLPLNAWWQVSTDSGTLVQVVDLDALGDQRDRTTNYYADDETSASKDTGDKLRYGEAGIVLTEAKGSISYHTAYYMVPDIQPNVGAQYANLFSAPLAVRPWLNAPSQTYLPAIQR